MSEYDRGAYTPPTEEAFAFDARTPQVRRPVPATLIGSVVVLVVLVGAVALFYWSGVRGAGEAPRPVGKPQLQIKTPPPADAKPIADDDGKLDVYDEEKGQAPAPAASKTAFAPPPEQPQPRPTAQAQAQAAPPPAQVHAQAAPLPAQAVAAKPAPAPVVSSAAVRTAAAAPASKPQPAPALRRNDAVSNLLARNEAPAAAAAKAAAPPAKAEVAPADAAHRVMVQIGAFSSSAVADEEFARTRSAFASYAAGKGKHVERAEVGGKAYWRTAFTGFDRAGAKAFCRALIAAKKGCIVR